MCWDAVVTSCTGGPEVIAHYIILAALLVPVPAWCDYGDGPVWCGTYTLSPGWEQAAISLTPCTSWTPPEPPEGAAWMVKMEAVDKAGNGSWEACEP